VVADLAPLLGARLVGRDVEALVNLPRVGHHDLAAELTREVEGELRLADAGGPDDDRDRGSQ